MDLMLELAAVQEGVESDREREALLHRVIDTRDAACFSPGHGVRLIGAE
jgi:hypothetical protein